MKRSIGGEHNLEDNQKANSQKYVGCKELDNFYAHRSEIIAVIGKVVLFYHYF